MKGQKLNFLEMCFFFEIQIPSANDFLVSSLQINFNHSCVKYASFELHQMKEEDLSFTNMIVSFIYYNCN